MIDFKINLRAEKIFQKQSYLTSITEYRKINFTVLENLFDHYLILEKKFFNYSVFRTGIFNVASF